MSKGIESTNLPRMCVDEAVSCLSGLFAGAIGRDAAFRDLPSVMLWGPPGVGKSQAVRQIGDTIHSLTNKRVEITDVRLLLFNPIDLRGIPTPNEDKTLAVWLRPKIFDLDSSEGVVNILLLDEISAAPPSVQSAAYQITLDRACGEHRLPENCIVIAAGNRLSDRSTAYRMPKALANRLLHIEVQADFASWRRWAVGMGVHEKVIAYLAFRPDRLMSFDAASNDLAFASPRSWAMVGSVLEGAGGDVDAAHPLVCGLVGSGAACEFRTWARVFGRLPDMDDVFSGRARKVPKGADALYALTAAMAAHARNHLGNPEAIEHSVVYAQQLPPDFSVMLLKDYLCLAPGCREALMRIPRFAKWLGKEGEMLNGSF